MCTPSGTLNYDKLAEVIVEMSKKYKKTMLASLMGLDEGITNREILAIKRQTLPCKLNLGILYNKVIHRNF